MDNVAANSTPLLVVENLKKHYKVNTHSGKHRIVRAVDGISFQIQSGTTLGIVGESGCGKSTAGRAILHLTHPTSGNVLFEGRTITALDRRELQELRKEMQIVFQDPYSSLNSRMKIKDILAEPFKIHRLYRGSELINQIKKLLEFVGLPESCLEKYPHEFSGGQRQRIVIARAIALRPKFIVCDEPVSALDVSVQAQIVNLFQRLQNELGITYLFISHDLSVVRHISSQVGVMYLGKMVELGDTDAIFATPFHPYTQALMSAIPLPDPKLQRQKERIVLKGDLPSPLTPPSGCRFHTRCPFAEELCRIQEPEWKEIEANHWVACHFASLNT
ncbi:dipeptide ABC transporter ATP-binding protein [Fodinisporobacter ferrooxydans]|uniref:Dipeptide ABC transporter ATP-binding protein n=1 Tax=Fodinisporobacter ferrooxydans TaxID=2901836 RepID=A0ABY4CMB9_9BACL|nr:dipeptide ABC transporter ATP-binding protein [Alicyclobacillaceae bacterium MYW30-H2]